MPNVLNCNCTVSVLSCCCIVSPTSTVYGVCSPTRTRERRSLPWHGDLTAKVSFSPFVFLLDDLYNLRHNLPAIWKCIIIGIFCTVCSNILNVINALLPSPSLQLGWYHTSGSVRCWEGRNPPRVPSKTACVLYALDGSARREQVWLCVSLFLGVCLSPAFNVSHHSGKMLSFKINM